MTTIMSEDNECTREFVVYKDSKVIGAPELMMVGLED